MQLTLNAELANKTDWTVWHADFALADIAAGSCKCIFQLANAH